MKLYNTLTKQIDTFKPLNKSEVLIYSCGPTVYNHLHVGNWSAYIYWDILVRALTLDGYNVRRTINLTDVGHLTSDEDEGDDKLAKKAKTERTTAWEIAKIYTKSFLDGFQALNLIQPTTFAPATDFINEQLKMIEILKQKGLTYQIDDGIYLDTAKIEDYGKLAGLNLDQLKAGARVNFNQQKRNITDFALWKFSLNQKRDMEWRTPEAILDKPLDNLMGFPGWHLECSAIAIKTLAPTIDIHTGGIDHIPVHHCNEIAQTESVTGQKMSQFWIHNNHLKVDGTKISKSLSNGYTLSDLNDRGFSPLDFKMFVLQSHYQTEGNFSFEILKMAQNRLQHWRQIACLRHQIYDGLKPDENKTISFLTAKSKILELANENLNTPAILEVIDSEFAKLKNTDSNYENVNLQSFREFLEEIDKLLGLELIKSTPDVSEEIKQLIQKRFFAKQERDFKTADAIRTELKENKIELNDSGDKSYWYYR